MTTLLYRKPRIFALAVLMMLAAGAAALTTIARQEDPTITNLFATIVTPYPGADPARVEALVTEKIEEELRQIAEIDEIKSVSRLGVSVVSVELSQFIAERPHRTDLVRDPRRARAMPREIFQPASPSLNSTTTAPALSPPSWRWSRHPAQPLAMASSPAPLNYSRTASAPLPAPNSSTFMAPPAKKSASSSTPQRLAALGLTAQDVSRAIASADSKVRAGQVRGAATDLLIEVAGEIKALDRVRAIPVRTGPDGRLVRVGDIAEIRRARQEPPASLAIVDGRKGIIDRSAHGRRPPGRRLVRPHQAGPPRVRRNAPC